jgi:hypothetical protein
MRQGIDQHRDPAKVGGEVQGEMEREARKESLHHQDSCLSVVRCLEGDSVFVVVEPRRILECPKTCDGPFPEFHHQQRVPLSARFAKKRSRWQVVEKGRLLHTPRM